MPRNSETERQRRKIVQVYLSYDKAIMSQLLHTAPSPSQFCPGGRPSLLAILN